MHRTLLGVAVAALAFCACEGADGSGDPARPDVLLVVLDTVRADHSSTYGYDRETTPRLDALAEVGVVFEDVTAPAPWTWPSHASLFTGEPPWIHGAHLVGGAGAADTRARFGMAVGALRPDLPTLAERFAAKGYRTRAVVVNDWLSPELGLLRGFEHAQRVESDARLIEAAERIVAEPDERPLFLFLNVMTAHSPFRDGPGPWALPDRRFIDPEKAPRWVRPYLTSDLPRGVHLSQIAAQEQTTGVVRYAAGQLDIPEPDMTKLRQLYDAGVRGADFVLGRVLEHWIAISPDGVVAVTSDHGESFGEHGALDHRVSLYPEVLGVPLVVAAPGRLPAGVRVGEPVGLHDLHPTLLDLAGVEAAARSLVPLASGGEARKPIAAAAWPDPVWAEHAGERFARQWRLFRRDSWALLIPDGDPSSAELYDLASDPEMREDRATREPERLAELSAAAAAHFGPQADAAFTTPLEIPDDVAQQLQRLGYSH